MTTPNELDPEALADMIAGRIAHDIIREYRAGACDGTSYECQSEKAFKCESGKFDCGDDSTFDCPSAFTEDH